MIPPEIRSQESRSRALVPVREVHQQVLILRFFRIEENPDLPAGSQAVKRIRIVFTDLEMKCFRLSGNCTEHLFFEQGIEFRTPFLFPLLHRLRPGEKIRQRIGRHPGFLPDEVFPRFEQGLDLEVQHIHPAGIVLRGETVAPEAEFRSYPQFGLCEERISRLIEALAVQTVPETAFGFGNVAFHPFRTDIEFHPDDGFRHVGIMDQRNVLGLKGMRKRFVTIRQDEDFLHRFFRPPGSAQALDVVQPRTDLRIRHPQSGVVIAHHGEAGLLPLLLQLGIRTEGQFGPHRKPLGRELL